MASRSRKNVRAAPPPRRRTLPRQALLLPHERDQDGSDSTDHAPDPVMKQALRDLERGLVDTDLRATPGLDAERRRQLLRRSAQRSVDVARRSPRKKKP